MWIREKYDFLKALFGISGNDNSNAHNNDVIINDFSDNIIIAKSDTAGPNDKYEIYWEYLLGDLDGII
ncbi:MAG: hypothetical protein K0R02_1129 [Rickettsiaceae bacterium]|jgi:hypothetical protein|nr:hypothetical protein [Rickettsiaceae bacterium]